MNNGPIGSEAVIMKVMTHIAPMGGLVLGNHIMGATRRSNGAFQLAPRIVHVPAGFLTHGDRYIRWQGGTSVIVIIISSLRRDWGSDGGGGGTVPIKY